MQVICPSCGHRAERDITVGEELRCSECDGTYRVLADGTSVAWEYRAEFVTHSTQPAERKLAAKGVLVMVLCWLGVILFLQSRSVLQNAQDKADSPPGDILAARGEVKAVAFSPDGARLATAGGIYKGRRRWETGEIRIWDPKTKACLVAFAGHPTGVTGLAFSPDGKRLVSASTDGVKVWDAASGKLLIIVNKSPNEEPWRVTYDPQGQRLAILSETADFHGGRTRLVLRVCRAPQAVADEEQETLLYYPFEAGSSTRFGWDVPRLAFSPDGMRLACGRDDTVLIWDFRPDRPSDPCEPALVLRGHTYPVRDQVFGPDGQQLATTGDDETLRIWDAATGRELLKFDSPRAGIAGYRSVDCLAYSPDGKYLAGGKAQNLAIWDAATGRELHFLRWHSGQIEGVAFSPDGRTLATGADDHHIKLWNLAALGLDK
ncbi:MAG TPA: WD40 repeat domain-containing protein [Gemmataceae bacterium]|nr:WD40 repeat domain-containing protein [Gemmataceae bacterium]